MLGRFLFVLLWKNGMWFFVFLKKKNIVVKNNLIINVDLSELIKK